MHNIQLQLVDNTANTCRAAKEKREEAYWCTTTAKLVVQSSEHLFQKQCESVTGCLFHSLSLFLQMLSCPLWMAFALSLPVSPSSSSSLLFQITSGEASFPFSEPFPSFSWSPFLSWKSSLFLHTIYSANLCLSNASAFSRATTSSRLFQMISRSPSPPPAIARPFSRLPSLTVRYLNILKLNHAFFLSTQRLWITRG